MMDTITEKCQKLKPILGSKLVDVLFVKYSTARDLDKKKRIERKINILYSKYIHDELDQEIVNLPPPPNGILDGEFRFGQILYRGKPTGQTFSMKPILLTRHVVIAGMTGSGKTNASYVMAKEFLRMKRHIILFDWKNDYRNLVKNEEFGNDIHVFSIGQRNMPIIPLNILIPPPGMDPRSYINHIVPIIGDALFLGEGVFALLRRGIDFLYRKHGIYSGQKVEEWPVVAELVPWLENNLKTRSSRDKEWKTSCMRAVEALCFGPFSKVINVAKPAFDIAQLLKMNVVIELGELSTAEKKVFIQTMLLWIRYYLKFNAQKNILSNGLFFEEAHHVLLKQRQDAGKDSEMQIALRELRQWGISCVVIDQCPSLLDPTVLSNSYTSICMYLKSAQDVNAMAASMFLDVEKKKLIGRLQIGEAIIKLAGEWVEPFLIRFPKVELKDETVSDDFVREHMKKKGFSPVSEMEHSLNGFWTEKTGGIVSDETNGAEKGEIPEIAGLTAEEERMLLDVYERPYVGLESHYEHIGRSKAKSIRLRDKLIKVGFISLVKEKIGVNMIGLLDITEKGKVHLAEKGIKIRDTSYREGSIAHRYLVHRLGKHFHDKGYDVAQESQAGNDHYVDLVAKKGNLPIAIEAETGRSDAIGNIRKNLAAKFNQILCVCMNYDVYHDILKKLKKEGLDEDKRIIVVCMDKYLKTT